MVLFRYIYYMFFLVFSFKTMISVFFFFPGDFVGFSWLWCWFVGVLQRRVGGEVAVHCLVFRHLSPLGPGLSG